MNKERVLKVVKSIPQGKFLTYKQVAKLSGNERAFRFVAHVMAKNVDGSVPCHRVIKSNYDVGGYLGSEKYSWLKAGLLLKEGSIGIIPTDTIYGICTSALNERSVEKVYKLRRRNPKKPCIILISKIDDLKIFGVFVSKINRKILSQIWPARISVIFKISNEKALVKFTYLHRGTGTLSFRLPQPKWLIKILNISGPIIAPSANWEGYEPAKTMTEAKKYFSNYVFYLNRGRLDSKPSTLVDISKEGIKIVRKGADYFKVINFRNKLK
ncbi:MAG: methylated-DNA--[protein]-cysteine S-methyltransferase [Patescibacteria group bacterium]|nr:methylated-DNA--[protein]-cysteine S-methyltransferase [Patescibacteria group bacterium]